MTLIPTKHNCGPWHMKLDDEEPIFTLRAQDAMAVPAIQAWVELCRAAGVSEEKQRGALDIAEAMLAWQKDHPPKLPD